MDSFFDCPDVSAQWFADSIASKKDYWQLMLNQNVLHKQYGIGQVIEVANNDSTIRVCFEDAGEVLDFSHSAFSLGEFETVNCPLFVYGELITEQMKEMVISLDQDDIDSNTELNFIEESFSEYGITSLWHMTHINNVSSICQNGIFNHYEVNEIYPSHIDISDPRAQSWREQRESCYHRKIHEYAPLYLNPRNPMLFVRKHLQHEICMIEVDLSVLISREYVLSDGNAAARLTKFYKNIEFLDKLPWDVIHTDFWSDIDDGKRKMCSEVLVYPKVDVKYIKALHCSTKSLLPRLKETGLPAFYTQELFF